LALVPARAGFIGPGRHPAGLHGRVRRQHGVRVFAPNRGSGRTGDCTEGGRQADARTRYAGRPLHKKYKIYLDHVGVAHVPDDYEERLTEIFPKVFKHLRLLALDPYDLALSKLERNIQRDRDDVMHLARTVPFDLEVLKDRYQKELRWQLGNPEREDLLAAMD
jgi:hypothetical protein